MHIAYNILFYFCNSVGGLFLVLLNVAILQFILFSKLVPILQILNCLQARNKPFFFSLKIDSYFIGQAVNGERGTDVGRSSIHYLIPQMATMATDDLV